MQSDLANTAAYPARGPPGAGEAAAPARCPSYSRLQINLSLQNNQLKSTPYS